MFSLRKIVFLTILLSLFFIEEEIAENNRILSFRKYGKFYGNFPYHNYKEISNNITFVDKLVIGPYGDYHWLLRPFYYFLFFYRVAHDAFDNGDTKNGIYFIILPLLNILSSIVPQYVWMICNIKPTKILFKLTFETGFYKLKYTERKFIKNKCDNISSEISKDVCSICQLPFEEVQGGDNNGKNNIIKLECPHYFHNDCIDEWIKKKCSIGEKPFCPICRKKIADINSNCIAFRIKDNDIMKNLAESVHIFSTCIYVDLILGVDNVKNRIINKQTYWSFGLVDLRIGTQAVWRGDNKWELKPFIGFCGLSISFFEIINISFIPMLYLVGWGEGVNRKMTMDICTEFTFYRKFFEQEIYSM